jgi:hypothetical protein
VDVFQSIYARTGLHVAANIRLAGEERTQIADLFLPRNLKSADLHDRLRAGESLRAEFEKFAKMRSNFVF